MTNINIGNSEGAMAQWTSRLTQDELSKIGVESTLVPLRKESGGHIQAIEKALLNGTIQVAVYPLNKLPIKLSDGLVITALAKRDDSADCLLIRHDAFDQQEIFRFKNGARIGANAPMQKDQLLDYRPDAIVETAAGNAMQRLDKLRAGVFDAVFISAAVIARLNPDLSGLEVIALNPREFTPAPGQGALAWLCHKDDLATRRIFLQIHHPSVSSCTNIERKVLQAMQSDNIHSIGAHCERDSTGNYHACAAALINGKMCRTQVSSSTTVGVAEKLIAGLKA